MWNMLPHSPARPLRALAHSPQIYAAMLADPFRLAA
jgi:hypothetical protein